MQTGLSLIELATKIEAQRSLKRDFIVDTAKTTMQVQRQPAVKGEPAATTVLELPGDHGTFPILETAHDQIGTRLNIPAKYYDRMRQHAPDLLATNVNAWFRQSPETRMVRTLGGDTRAFLSNRYQRIENEEIAEVALPILMDIPDVKIVSCEVTARRMYIQAVSPRVQGEVKRGDVVQAGVIISNSEIGQGAVVVSPLIYRLICLNGMVANDGKMRGYHVGGRVDSNEELWADDTRKADDRAILLKVRDTVRAAVAQAAFDDRVAKLRGLTDMRVTGNPAQAVEVLAQKVGASEEEKGGILRALIEGGDLSAWGVLNAVTAQAHAAKSYDRGVEFESMGGALVDLPPTEWRRVLEAA
jgi:Domain of unknown function (DUF932)